MVDKSKKAKKGSITEEGASALLQRYSMSTVLSLLQEVAQMPNEKIDWHEVVKNSATGISGAREYQMLWRHLAYGETLTDRIDDDANPVDDDSDLEYEMEAVPAVGREASLEAAACVKVLIAAGCTKDSTPSNSTIDAPLTINVPSSRQLASDGSILAKPTQGTNISIPVSVHKQPISSGIVGEKRPNNGTSGVDMGPRRKRKAWSSEDDTKLQAAVQKYGEGHWAIIARVDFMNDRKASELSQRWSSLRKKQGNLNAGMSSQLAATHRAVSLALNMPMGESLKTVSQLGADHQFGRTWLPRPRIPTLRPPVNSISNPDSMVKAAAVAAGARIATSSDASSLIEAARSQNVMHITTSGSSAIKSSPSGISSQLPSNVHFIRNGLAKAPISTYTAATPNVTRPIEAQQVQARPIRQTTPAAQANPAVVLPLPYVRPAVENPVASISSAATLPKVAENTVASSLINEAKETAQRNQADVGSCTTPVDQQQPRNQSDVCETSQACSKLVGKDGKIPDKEIHQYSSSGNRNEDAGTAAMDGKE